MKKLEEFLDSCSPTSYDFSLKEEERDPNFVLPNVESDSDWLLCMYHTYLCNNRKNLIRHMQLK